MVSSSSSSSSRRVRAGVAALVFVSHGACASAQAPPRTPVPPPATAPATFNAVLGWPRGHTADGVTFAVHQPQIERWDGDRLSAQAAVVVRDAGGEQVGIVSLDARTHVDKVARLVDLSDVRVAAASFPQHRDREPAYKAALDKALPDVLENVPLDHLEANLAVTANAAAARAVPVRNDVPDIRFATSPTLLVLVDGDPTLRDVAGHPGLMRVINTRALVVLDQRAGMYYLRAAGGWYASAAATGAWTRLANAPPPAVAAVAAPLAADGVVDLLDPKAPGAAPAQPPAVVLSTRPAELVQTAGEPQYVPVPGTQLLYVKNTDAALFLEVTTQRHFVLVSGRWFAAPAFAGPWQYVPGPSLPNDFAKIPPDSPKANVLVSVPGTDQAKQAAVATAIPQTATVRIADAQLDAVAYDGTPRFEEIKEAKGLAYAVNSPLPVIRVDADNTFWAVKDGVWFTAGSALGPWRVATAVPPVVYTIPVSSPVHYVTYVRVYGATSEVVYVGYTPGYMGAYVSPAGTVVYGTGYVYPAYVGAVWVGYPPTYGYGAGFACGVATGLAFGFAAGAILGDCWAHPYWGPCRGYAHVDINSSAVYHNWRGGVTFAARHYSYDGWTGESWDRAAGRTFNPYTGRATAGGYSNYFNRESGDFDLARGGATYNPHTGVIRAGGREVRGDLDDLGDVDVDRARARINTRTDTAVGYKDGDVYAGHDGNVYRYNHDDGWQRHTDDGWKDSSRDRDFSAQRQRLDAQRQSRALGQQRFSNWNGGGSGGRLGQASPGGGRLGGLRRR